MCQPACRGTAGAGRHVFPLESMEDIGDLVWRALQAWHNDLTGKAQGATHRRVCGAQSLGHHLVHGGRVPAARVQLL